MTFQEIIDLYQQAKKIFDADINWELKYNLIFSPDISRKVAGRFDWYDPDTSYEEDVFYFKIALDEWIEKQEIIAKQIDLDFE